MVDAISFVKDAKVGTDLTVEADWKRRALYLGPQFDTLDISLQEEFQKFLQERGINESLALFIPEYAEHKEQQVRLFSFASLWFVCLPFIRNTRPGCRKSSPSSRCKSSPFAHL